MYLLVPCYAGSGQWSINAIKNDGHNLHLSEVSSFKNVTGQTAEERSFFHIGFCTESRQWLGGGGKHCPKCFLRLHSCFVNVIMLEVRSSQRLLVRKENNEISRALLGIMGRRNI